jgi:hypothetical protein
LGLGKGKLYAKKWRFPGFVTATGGHYDVRLVDGALPC